MPQHIPRPVLLFAATLGLLGCAVEPKPVEPLATAAPVAEPMIGNGAVAVPKSGSADGRAGGSAQILRGTGTFVAATRSPSVRPVVTADDRISLNFVNADVSEVAKAVLGDFLKLNYVVDASVQGAVTLQTSQPLARQAVLPAVEAAFRLSGLALVLSDGTYRIVPLAEAARQSGIARLSNRPGEAGFGVEIVPLHFVGAQEMQHMLEPLAPSGAVLRADAARNLLVISGTAEERAALIDNVRLFDVDWMAGMSFALFPLHAADAKTVATELGSVIGTKDGPLSGIVKLTPIARMNAILAISPQPKYLDTLQSWIDRLDRAQESSEQQLYVYYVQNGKAADLAGVLEKALGLQSTESVSKASGTGKDSAALPAIPEPVMSQLTATPPGKSSASAEDGSDATTAGAGSAKAATNLRITADQTTNALLVLATPHDYHLVENALLKLDIPPLQVMLEAAVAEVTLTSDLSFGMQYYFAHGSGHQILLSNGSATTTSTTTTTTGTTTTTAPASAASTLSPLVPGFNYIFNSGADIQAVLSTLESITTVKVLSAPEVLVLNNQAATLQVGDQVPVATQSSVSTETSGAPEVNSIQYLDTGVILKVTPRVNEGGLVTIDVDQEVSDAAATTSSALDSPTIEQRKITSTVAVQDGETVALGGLISDSRSNGRSGIPYLQDIPYVGALFGTRDDSVTRTELLVLITPHVVQGVQKLRGLTEELKRQMPATLPVFHQGS